jgi:hypothetical protein
VDRTSFFEGLVFFFRVAMTTHHPTRGREWHYLGTAVLGAAIAALGVACGLDTAGESGGDGGSGSSSGLDGSSGSGGSSGSSPADGSGASSSSGGGSGGGSDGSSGSGSGAEGGSGGASSSSGSSSGSSGGPTDATNDAPVVAPPEFAWYKLDETNGNTAHDSTANHYDIQLQQVTWASGANFTLPTGGSSHGGSATVGAGLRQAPVSFTAWLAPASRADETSNNYAITPFPPSAVSGDVAGQYGFGIGLDVWTDGGGGSALAVENVGYTFLGAGGSQFTAGTEYFVVAAIGPTANVYVNGTLVGTTTPTTPGPAAMTTLSLGVHNNDMGYGTKRFYAGRMRDVRIYKRELTAQEVSVLYADGPAP